MHEWTEELEAEAQEVIDTLLGILRTRKDPRWGAEFVDDLEPQLAEAIGADGKGNSEALRLFRDVVLPACRPNDCPMMLSYVPTAPTMSAKLCDTIVGAASIFAGHWEAGAGAIAAENQALAWLAGLAGYPSEAGGCFVAGGSAANLSALAVARKMFRERSEAVARFGPRPAVLIGDSAHTSVAGAAELLDLEVITAPTDPTGRLRGESARQAAAARDDLTVMAVVASGGSTLTGSVDDLEGLADLCDELGAWLHVDAAYGGAGIVVPELGDVFAGFGRSSSFSIDPHKWLFTPYDCAALVYRDPILARRTFPQRASYLDEVDRHDRNPADLAFHLSRRARGLPLWFSLVANGTDAYVDAVRHTVGVAHELAESVRAHDQFELVMEPSLSVVLFRRRGWSRHDYLEWARSRAADGLALINPVDVHGATCFRACIVNPLTEHAALVEVLDDMAASAP